MHKIGDNLTSLCGNYAIKVIGNECWQTKNSVFILALEVLSAPQTKGKYLSKNSGEKIYMANNTKSQTLT